MAAAEAQGRPDTAKSAGGRDRHVQASLCDAGMPRRPEIARACGAQPNLVLLKIDQILAARVRVERDLREKSSSCNAFVQPHALIATRATHGSFLNRHNAR